MGVMAVSSMHSALYFAIYFAFTEKYFPKFR